MILRGRQVGHDACGSHRATTTAALRAARSCFPGRRAAKGRVHRLRRSTSAPRSPLAAVRVGFGVLGLKGRSIARVAPGSRRMTVRLLLYALHRSADSHLCTGHPQYHTRRTKAIAGDCEATSLRSAAPGAPIERVHYQPQPPRPALRLLNRLNVSLEPSPPARVLSMVILASQTPNSSQSSGPLPHLSPHNAFRPHRPV